MVQEYGQEINQAASRRMLFLGILFSPEDGATRSSITMATCIISQETMKLSVEENETLSTACFTQCH
jgi:hypothetical protein